MRVMSDIVLVNVKMISEFNDNEVLDHELR
jgi:hypothetical protein